MKVELTKAGKSITVYSPNVDGLNYDQAYGVPVRDDRGDVIGFVSDADEKHIYMHIFDKETLDMEQPPTSFEIVNA